MSDVLDKWDERFFALARHISSWSKDPKAQVGAVIADRRRRVVALGFNGFPIGVEDSAERLADSEQKNEMVVHAEENAVLFAGRSAADATIYVFGKPICSRCAGVIIQAGIVRAVAAILKEGTDSKWDKSGLIGQRMLQEAQVALIAAAPDGR